MGCTWAVYGLLGWLQQVTRPHTRPTSTIIPCAACPCNQTRPHTLSTPNTLPASPARGCTHTQGKELSDHDVEELVQEESQLFKERGLPRSAAVTPVLDILDEARRRGLKVAVCSGGRKDAVERVGGASGRAGEGTLRVEKHVWGLGVDWGLGRQGQRAAWVDCYATYGA